MNKPLVISKKPRIKAGSIIFLLTVDTRAAYHKDQKRISIYSRAVTLEIAEKANTILENWSQSEEISDKDLYFLRSNLTDEVNGTDIVCWEVLCFKGDVYTAKF